MRKFRGEESASFANGRGLTVLNDVGTKTKGAMAYFSTSDRESDMAGSFGEKAIRFHPPCQKERPFATCSPRKEEREKNFYWRRQEKCEEISKGKGPLA